MPLISEFRIDVIETFRKLKAAVEALSLCMQADQTLPAWFNPPEDLPLQPNLNTRSQALSLIRQFEYLDHQKPREILVGAGLIAASQNTIDAILQVNQAKDEFKKAMIQLKNANIKLNDEALNAEIEQLLGKRVDNSEREQLLVKRANSELNPTLDKRPNITAETLKRIGLSRLHLKQCYRRIPFFNERPSKVSWTWANTRAITKITVEEAIQMLLKQGNDFNIEAQLQKVQSLNPKQPLAIVQELAPHLRANVVFKNSKDGERRLMVKGPIPLFYLDESCLTLPDIKPPGQKRGRNKDRSVRSDVKLDPEPFLPSIRVHRYL